MKFLFFLIVALSPCTNLLYSQVFYRGADLSYVNEMEDCGVVYKENNTPKEVYQIFSDHGCNMARFRIWHSPSWYDNLNSGLRYSDLKDVKKSIRRAREKDMAILLDFHLSDTWADPSRQLVPASWLPVVNDLPILKDSVYNYIFRTLSILDDEGLLPEMVQIGNETNRGIILSPQDNSQWTLDWNRNSQLFNSAIQAVRDLTNQRGKHIDIALHFANPSEVNWLLDGFLSHGVVDFDVIGMSYYWAWHKPTSMIETGNIIEELKQKNPGKKVFIFETGYIWTTLSNDGATNIISETHPDYSPASPDNQLRWLRDMTDIVRSKGCDGVLYWEPAWVSSNCYTQWGRGSHQEHAAFFDFTNDLIKDGGIKWMKDETLSTAIRPQLSPVFTFSGNEVSITLNAAADTADVYIYNESGMLMDKKQYIHKKEMKIGVENLRTGLYFFSLICRDQLAGSFKFFK